RMAGFNIEIKRQSAVFHVQTQDLGPSARCVESLIYKSGRLLSSRKTYYTSWLASPHLQEKILQMMDEQHHAIIKEIADGKFDHYLSSEEKQGFPEKS
ncbi:MAG: hypothetical protein AB1715_06795, partial [Acidobacteriota bacterium]